MKCTEYGAAICTERVEAKQCADDFFVDCVAAICTERVEAKGMCDGFGVCDGAAICTERVEAKVQSLFRVRRVVSCNLHGACGGKATLAMTFPADSRCNLHGACGGKADDCQFVHCFSYCNLHGACGDKAKSYSCFFSFRIVAICTEHVGAKRNGFPTVPASFCCNLHAACGGKRVVVDIHRIISYGCNLPPKKIQ